MPPFLKIIIDFFVDAILAVVNFFVDLFLAILGLFRRLPPKLTHTVKVVRKEDLLNLEFRFYNLRFEPPDNGAPAKLVRTSQNAPAYIAVVFPPQNIAEQAFFESSGDLKKHEDKSDHPNAKPDTDPSNPDVLPGTPFAQSRLASESRLVFVLPAGTNEIEYRLDQFLGWSKLTPHVVPVALPPDPQIPPGNAPQIREPFAWETAIECPYRLILSNSKNAVWQHAVDYVEKPEPKPGDPEPPQRRIELWHTRLRYEVFKRFNSPSPSLRAVWSPDYLPKGEPTLPDPPVPFRMSLDQFDRDQLVENTSNFSQWPWFKPEPVTADRFMLSALGAWVDLKGKWDTKPVRAWNHRGTMGRDHYVRVVYAGYLFPFGHKASLIKITERKFEPHKSGDLNGQVAYLRQRMFIVVREPVKEYPTSGQLPKQVRELPFIRVEIKTLVTPNIDLPTAIDPNIIVDHAFWPMVNKEPFHFHVVATDKAGQQCELTIPLIFVKQLGNESNETIDTLVNYYEKLQKDDYLIMRPLSGQAVAYTEEQKRGDATLETESLTFGSADLLKELNAKALQPRFYPTMRQAKVRIPAVEQLLGLNKPVTIEYQSYPDFGYGADNKWQVFAKLADNKTLPIEFAGDKSLGVVAPNMAISGLSRRFGPIAAMDKIAKDNEYKFTPADFFNHDSPPVLLGGIPLTDILTGGFADGDSSGALAASLSASALANQNNNVPKLTYTLIPATGTPTAVEARMYWKPKVVATKSIGFLTLTLDQTNGLIVEGVATKPLDKEGGIDFRTTARLQNIALNFADVIAIEFKEIKFESRNGSKPDVHVVIKDVSFLGPLAFLSRLDELLPKTGTGFDDPPFLDVDAERVVAGYTLGIPNVQVGVFSLENLSLTAALTLSFENKPASVRFAFSQRHQPFLLTVSLFAGGGFFAIGVDSKGVQLVEGALEFGGNLSLNLGVASGGVYVLGGIYFKLQQGKDALIEGYQRMGGALSILGIATVCVEFYMGLSYQGDKVKGQAQAKACVKVAFVKKCVHMTVERQFAGSESDPTFWDLLPPVDQGGNIIERENFDGDYGKIAVSPFWEDYVAAYAAYPGKEKL